MTKKREATERQLEQAKQAAEAREGVLRGKGIDADRFSRDTIWRNLRSQTRKIRSRLNQIGVIETREKEMEERRAAKTAAAETATAETE